MTACEKSFTEKEPKGADLLALLIDLLAEQEGVTISYEIVGRDKTIHRRRNHHERDQQNRGARVCTGPGAPV